MINISFLIKPSEINQNGLCAIYCRFQVSGTLKKEKSTKIFVSPESWDQQNQKILTPKGITKNQKEQIETQNQTLLAIANKIRTIYNSLSYSGKENITAQDIKIELEGKNKGKNIYEAIDKFAEEFKEGKTQKEKLNRIKQVIEVFLLDVYKKENMLLYEIEEQTDFIQRFETYVAGENKRLLKWSGSYILKMLPYLKKTFDIAKRNKWIRQNPMDNYKPKSKKQNIIQKTPLTREELDKIKKQNFDSDSLSRYADIFVFQCLTSLRYSDAKALEYSDIKELEDGTRYIKKPSQKTGTEFLIPLVDEAYEIIEKYKIDMHTRIYHQNKCFPVKSNANYNKRLKTIADICGIKKHLSTHVARYTCNQLLFEIGMSDEKRKQILGHTEIKMTEHYTTKDIKILFEGMKKISSK